MKNLLTCLLLLVCPLMNGQELEIPTLKSKGIATGASKVEVSQFEYAKDKGLILTQSDVETYDPKGRLVTIDRKVISTGLSYKYTYKLSRKGVLEEEKIINAANNETVRITTYGYKKSRLVSTTQVQGTITFVKNYSYNKEGHLIKIEAIENGTSKGEEIYQVDDEGRRTRYSQKLPTEEIARMISGYTYFVEKNIETKTEIRNVNGVKYEIVATKNLGNKRSIKETTRKLSDSQSGFNEFLFEEDDKGSWIKGEIVDNQLGRSRVILKKITYTDGAETGRLKMTPEDSRARYYRQNSQFQVVYNGKVVSVGSAENLVNTNDRLVYSAADSVMILLKGYDDKAYQSNWHKAEIISHGKDKIVWLGKSSGIDVFQKGKKLIAGRNSNTPIGTYKVGNTIIVYVRQGIQKTFIAKGFDTEQYLGKLNYPEFTEEHTYWGKASDSTYALASHGNSISIKSQSEDKKGNIIVKSTTGDWYSLAGFRENFNDKNPGDIFSAVFLNDPLKQIKEDGLFAADFSSFKHDNFKKSQYNLKTIDGQRVSGLALPTQKTKDNELITYFPLTKQYLKMDGYYAASEDEDLLDQPVSVLLDGFPDSYYVYNDGANIGFYQQGVTASKYRFGAHKLREDTNQYGAVLYDSVRVVTYGMNYDLALGDVMGPMKKLTVNQYNVFLLKLENGKWIVFNRGGKIADYQYTTIDGDNAVLFFQDHKNKIGAYRFEGYAEAKVGDFIASHYVTDQEAIDLSERLNINPFQQIGKDKNP